MNRICHIAVDSARLRERVFSATAILAVLSLLMVSAGPAISEDVHSLSPTHSHVFLTPEAAANHSHAADGESEHDVVNTGSHYSDSAQSAVHSGASGASFGAVKLTTTSLLQVAETDRSDPFSAVPDQPPRLS